jgi:phosphatidylglycerophosphatase A
VWDEILAFWAILWLLAPASFQVQLAAFVLFRFFDAVKPGPVAWADRLFKPGAGQPPGWRQGVGILLDDAVAALCTLLVLALWRVLVG